MAIIGSENKSKTLGNRATKLIAGFNKFITGIEGVIKDAEVAKDASDERIKLEKLENEQLGLLIEEQTTLLDNFKNLLNK